MITFLKSLTLIEIFECSVFFFFKQKTAYEMRISDWSSDVCSSDLVLNQFTLGDSSALGDTKFTLKEGGTARGVMAEMFRGMFEQATNTDLSAVSDSELLDCFSYTVFPNIFLFPGIRSEEHTSELQSLMRISYAVFCLKNKNEPHSSNGDINQQLIYPNLHNHNYKSY